LIGELHIVIDNTFPKSLAQELEAYWRVQYPLWTVQHENDLGKASTIDAHWIPRLANQRKKGRWVVITADAGVNDVKMGDKLPVLCKKHGHAYLILSALARTSAHYKAAISSVWPELPLVVAACDLLKHKRAHVGLGMLSNDPTKGYALRVYSRPLREWMAENA